MNSKPYKRIRVLADWKLQGALCLRLAIYWFICQGIFALSLVGFAFLHQTQTVSDVSLSGIIIPAALMASLVLPVVIVDLLVFSNRFAGPYMRLRRGLHDLTEGHDLQVIHFRKRDYYPESANHLNEIQARLKNDSNAEKDQGKHIACPVQISSSITESVEA